MMKEWILILTINSFNEGLEIKDVDVMMVENFKTEEICKEAGKAINKEVRNQINTMTNYTNKEKNIEQKN